MKTLDTLKLSRDVVGISVGILMVSAWPLRYLMLSEPGWLLVLIIFLSSVSGFIAGALASRGGFAPPDSVRRGLWTAGASSVTAASVFTLMAKATIANDPVVARAMVGCVLSILPGMFYGMIAAGISALTLSVPKEPESQSSVQPAGHSWNTRVVVFVLALAALAMPQKRNPEPEPLIASQPVVEQPKQETPPPFTYSLPIGLASAQSLQWNRVAEQVFFNIIDDLVTLSQDGHWLAYVPAQELEIRIVDLHAPANIRSIRIPQNLARLTFNPSADRLFVTTSGSDTRIAVVDIAGGQFIRLPQPKHKAMPPGPMVWWKDKEVVIGSTNEKRSILNLDTLELDKADDLSSWRIASVVEKEAVDCELSGEFPHTSRWRWAIQPLIMSAEHPDETGATGWKIKQSNRLAILHSERDSSVVFRTVLAEASDRFLFARDGSKAIRVHDGKAHVHYFDLAAVPHLKWSVNMPHSISECPDFERVESALKAGTLSALIYRPLNNPLTSQVIGPDRETPKAKARILEWKDKVATIYLPELFSPCSAGDVIADVCEFDTDRSELFVLKTPHRWWTQLSEPEAASDPLGSIPTSEERSRLLSDSRAARETARKAEAEAGLKAKRLEQEKLAERQRDNEEAMKRRISSSQVPNIPANSVEQRVSDFVRAHHQKIVDGDVAGMVRDYALRVDHFGNGIKDRDWILRDELTYHSNHAVLEETVDGPIRINRLPLNGGFTASYLLRVRTMDKSNYRPGGGDFEVNLIIIETANGLQISRHRSERKP